MQFFCLKSSVVLCGFPIIAIFVAKNSIMRTKRSSNSNMRFLKGNVIFFALLLLTIMLFAYYALQGMDEADGNEASCRVLFSAGYDAPECEIFIGDSLLYAGAPLPVDSQLVMKRYAQSSSRVSLYTSESVLRVVVQGDTVSRTLHDDRVFCIGARDGKTVIEAVEE